MSTTAVTYPSRSHRLLVGGTSQLGVRALSVLVTTVATAFLARHLGPSRFGELTVIVVVSLLLSSVGDAGLPMVAGRDWPRVTSQRSSWLGSFLRARWITAAAIAVVATAVAVVVEIPSTLRAGIILVGLTLPFALRSNVSIALLNAEFEPGRSAFVEVVSRAVWLIGIGIVLVLDGGVVAVVLAMVASTVASFLFAVRTERSVLPQPDVRLKRTWWPMARSGLALALLPILGMAYARADTLLLAIRATDDVVGIYGVIYRIVDVLLGLVAVVSAMFLPLLASAPDDASRLRIYQRAQRLFLLTFMPLAIGVAALATAAIRLVGGSQFAGTRGTGDPAVALVLLMAAFVAMLFGATNGSVLLVTGRQRWLYVHFALFLPANLLLSWVLIGRWSFVGAAAATLATEISAAAFSTWLASKALGRLHLLRNLRWLLVPAGALIAVLLVTRGWHPAARVVVGGSVYTVMGLVTPLKDDVVRLVEGLNPRGPSMFARGLRRVRSLILRAAGVPDPPRSHVDPLMSWHHELEEGGAVGVGDSERVIEIPWAISRYAGEERVLEVGYAFADPRYLAALYRLQIPELHGFDQTPAHRPWMRTTHGDIRSTPYPDEYFDLVFCISTIEHIGADTTMYGGQDRLEEDADFETLEELCRITRAGGRVLITVPFGEGYHAGWFRHYDLDRWRRLIDSTELETRRTDYFIYEDGRGYRRSTPEELSDVRYGTRGSRYAAGVACAELRRRSP